ncbi:hypothetical protein RJT34_15961 [Clitoria ternatea]|uniref:FBD domain-containing protein n=1 Tax=Clitoria ternatea TaxID=43366 RepID=A0AAN9J6C6_CLITE
MSLIMFPSCPVAFSPATPFIFFPTIPNLMKLLAACPMLEDLQIRDLAFDDLEDSPNSPDFKTCFTNLSRVYIVDCYLPITLKPLYNVKFLHIEINKDNMERYAEYTKGDQEHWEDPEFVPECLSLHLRTCIFDNFAGLHGELQFARYILKNARVLQSMKIRTRGYKIDRRKLSSCRRRSATCQLSFS